MPINQPSNQIKLTNISIVRLRKGGKRFEIAAYRNKVLEWRSGTETDIDEVLQVRNVFINVPRGLVAKTEDLRSCFNTTNIDDIVKLILAKGEMQKGERERSHQSNAILKDICTIISSKCVNPITKRPYPVTIIEKALLEIGYSIHPSKPAKVQALEAIKRIQELNKLPIQRASMRLRIFMGIQEGKACKGQLKLMVEKVEYEDLGFDYEAIVHVQPGVYRDITELVHKQTKGKGQVEVLSLCEVDVSENILS